MKTKQQIQHQIFENKLKLLIMQLHLLNMRGSYPEMLDEPNITIIEDSFGNKMYTPGIIGFELLSSPHKWTIKTPKKSPICVGIEYQLSKYNNAIRINGKILNRLNHWDQKLYNLEPLK